MTNEVAAPSSLCMDAAENPFREAKLVQTIMLSIAKTTFVLSLMAYFGNFSQYVCFERLIAELFGGGKKSLEKTPALARILWVGATKQKKPGSAGLKE